jgi:predicted AlkP superfamily phosphohydrolase/phosphomutase
MKELIIGVDAASPLLIRRWIDQLPHLRSIMENGVSGTLESVVPPSSVPAWQCFATGKNPARIGVFGFAYIGRDRILRHGRTTQDLGCFWDICSEKGLKVGVLNVPGTHPPYPVNGFMVSGFPAPPRSVWAYPKDIMKRLDSAVGGYRIDSPLTSPSELKGGEDEYLRQVEKMQASRIEAAKFLTKWFQPDIFFLTLQGVDMVQHDFWRYIGTNSPYANTLLNQYRKTDDAIGELMRLGTQETNVLILSDHGSTRTSTSFYINKYLESQGLLVLRAQGKVKHAGNTYSNLRKLLLKTVPPGLIATLYGMSPNFLSSRLTNSAKIERTLVEIVENVDWDRSTAFSTGGHEAAIYLTGAQDRGTSLEAHDEPKAISKICNMISGLRHPVTGEKLRPVFHLKEKTFRGDYLDEAPDLCVELFAGEEKIQVNPKLGAKEIWSSKPHFSAIHTRNGFWAMSGPGVRGSLSQDASLLDLAPTLLSILGFEPPTDMDGRVLEEVLRR